MAVRKVWLAQTLVNLAEQLLGGAALLGWMGAEHTVDPATAAELLLGVPGNGVFLAGLVWERRFLSLLPVFAVTLVVQSAVSLQLQKDMGWLQNVTASAYMMGSCRLAFAAAALPVRSLQCQQNGRHEVVIRCPPPRFRVAGTKVGGFAGRR